MIVFYNKTFSDLQHPPILYGDRIRIVSLPENSRRHQFVIIYAFENHNSQPWFQSEDDRVRDQPDNLSITFRHICQLHLDTSVNYISIPMSTTSRSPCRSHLDLPVDRISILLTITSRYPCQLHLDTHANYISISLSTTSRCPCRSHLDIQY